MRQVAARGLCASMLLAALAPATAQAADRRLGDAQRLAIYRAHAGAPVGYFQYLGRLNDFVPLGDSAVAVWTRPRQAWLLELAGPCPELPYAPVIGVTSSNGRVTRHFDRVVPRSRSPVQVSCPISTIRPLDVAALRAAEDAARAQPAPSLPEPAATPWPPPVLPPAAAPVSTSDGGT